MISGYLRMIFVIHVVICISLCRCTFQLEIEWVFSLVKIKIKQFYCLELNFCGE